MIFHVPPEDPPACPKCAALEAEIARLQRAVEEMARQQRLELERQIAHERNAKAALASELAAAVRARAAALLDLRCQETPENARAWDAADVRVKDLLRRVDAGAGEAR